MNPRRFGECVASTPLVEHGKVIEEVQLNMTKETVNLTLGGEK